jgi:hypothetical protein
MIGISAATDGVFGAARVEMMSSSLVCLYITGAIRLAAGPESFGITGLRSAVPSRPRDLRERAFYKDGSGIRLAGKICMNL